MSSIVLRGFRPRSFSTMRKARYSKVTFNICLLDIVISYEFISVS